MPIEGGPASTKEDIMTTESAAAPSAAITPADGITLQRIARGGGYQGPNDGVPGPNTWRALQRIAQRGGYAGPVDGVPGPNTYAGLAELLVRSEHD
jgi:peptidoglycan hydrolase-like protein with peptidoglycan-binding domain